MPKSREDSVMNPFRVLHSFGRVRESDKTHAIQINIEIQTVTWFRVWEGTEEICEKLQSEK